MHNREANSMRHGVQVEMQQSQSSNPIAVELAQRLAQRREKMNLPPNPSNEVTFVVSNEGLVQDSIRRGIRPNYCQPLSMLSHMEFVAVDATWCVDVQTNAGFMAKAAVQKWQRSVTICILHGRLWSLFIWLKNANTLIQQYHFISMSVRRFYLVPRLANWLGYMLARGKNSTHFTICLISNFCTVYQGSRVWSLGHKASCMC